MIIDGFVHQLPDTDPTETEEWLAVARRRRRRPRQDPRPLPHVEAARACPRAAGRPPRHGVHALRQHHPARRGTVVPGRRGARAAHPRLHPLERGGHGHQGQQARRRHRRPPVHVRLVGGAVRRRVQPLLPGQVRRAARRRRLHPGPRGARHLRPRVPRGPAHRGRPRPVPPGGRRWPVELPAPSAHARVLGVPHRVDGARARSTRSTTPGYLRYLHNRRIDDTSGTRVWCFIGDGEIDEPETLGAPDPPRPRPARQPDLGHQLQPAAPRRARPGQRQGHPGARGRVPRRRVERHQGRVGQQVGRAPRPRQGRRARSTG